MENNTSSDSSNGGRVCGKLLTAAFQTIRRISHLRPTSPKPKPKPNSTSPTPPPRNPISLQIPKTIEIQSKPPKIGAAEVVPIKIEPSKSEGGDLNATFSEYVDRTKKGRMKTNSDFDNGGESLRGDGVREMKQKGSFKDQCSEYIHKAKLKMNKTTSSAGSTGKTVSFKRE